MLIGLKIWMCRVNRCEIRDAAGNYELNNAKRCWNVKYWFNFWDLLPNFQILPFESIVVGYCV